MCVATESGKLQASPYYNSKSKTCQLQTTIHCRYRVLCVATDNIALLCYKDNNFFLNGMFYQALYLLHLMATGCMKHCLRILKVSHTTSERTEASKTNIRFFFFFF